MVLVVKNELENEKFLFVFFCGVGEVKLTWRCQVASRRSGFMREILLERQL